MKAAVYWCSGTVLAFFYIFLSTYPSKDSNNILSNEYLNGCRAGSHIGFYFHPSTDDPGVCYITEGEKKAIVANYFLRCIVISLPGVNSHAKLTKTDKSGRSVLDFLKTLVFHPVRN